MGQDNLSLQCTREIIKISNLVAYRLKTMRARFCRTRPVGTLSAISINFTKG